MCRLNFSDKNMMCDYHLHSEFSFDSSEKIEAICEKAVQSGIREIAITDHAEFPVRDSAPWPVFRRRAEVLDFCRIRFGENLIIRKPVSPGTAIARARNGPGRIWILSLPRSMSWMDTRIREPMPIHRRIPPILSIPICCR